MPMVGDPGENGLVITCTSHIINHGTREFLLTIFLDVVLIK